MSNATFVNADRRQPPPNKLTYQEFFDWCDDKSFAEWVDGEVHLLPEVTRDHALLVGFLLFLLTTYVEEHDLGVVMSAPFQVRLRTTDHVRVPDITFTMTEHNRRITEYCIDGPPDLIVQVVRSETTEGDTLDRSVAYATEGVREYWIVDPMTRRTDFFVLREDGRYVRVDPSPKGVYRSHVLNGLWIRTNWLWADPLPDMDDVVNEWKTGTED